MGICEYGFEAQHTSFLSLLKMLWSSKLAFLLISGSGLRSCQTSKSSIVKQPRCLEAQLALYSPVVLVRLQPCAFGQLSKKKLKRCVFCIVEADRGTAYGYGGGVS
jgi:hypothetical protein